MMEKRELTCICCPIGCQISVERNGDEFSVTGNTCPRGRNYAINEMTNPVRTVTSSVYVVNGCIGKASVKTKSDIPKDKIFEVMEEIRKVKVNAPVSIGDVIIENVANTGVDVVATKNVDKK